MKTFYDERALADPAGNTRSQSQKSDAAAKKEEKAVDRVEALSRKDTSSIVVTFVDNKESQSSTGRADDGANESVILSKIAEHAVLNSIGKMKKNDAVSLQIALKDSTEALKVYMLTHLDGISSRPQADRWVTCLSDRRISHR